MRTNQIKALAEQWEDEYEEYAEECLREGNEPMDIFTWVVTEQMTAQEAQNDYLRDEGLD